MRACRGADCGLASAANQGLHREVVYQRGAESGKAGGSGQGGCRGEVLEVVKLVPLERVQRPSVEHGAVPQISEETVEAVTLVPRERVHQQTAEQRVDERGQQRTAEQSEDVPQWREETVEAVRSVPCERVQQRALHVQERIAKQNVSILVPLDREETRQLCRSSQTSATTLCSLSGF